MSANASEQRVIEAEAARPRDGAERLDRQDRARQSGFRLRFSLVYVALAVVAGVGIGAFVVLVSRPEAAPAPSWSSWQPDGSREARAKQIADHVSTRYRLPSGNQLVIALASTPKVTGNADVGDIPVSAIAIRPDTSKGQAEEEDIDIVTDAPSTGMQYSLCGLGQACSITEGKPSEERHEMLRRQALELSLYTFKYVPDVGSVTVFLPPRPDGSSSPTAIFLKKGDVDDLLSKPLTRSLSSTVPQIGAIPKAELATVNGKTRAHLYSYEYQQAQDGSAILVLSPIITG